MADRRLAQFLAESRWQDIPSDVRRQARHAILNIAGCIIAGRQDPAVTIIRDTFPGEEALIDGAAATADDYDDTHLSTVLHVTPPIAGALFSLARKRDISGTQFLHAFVLGMETTCRLGSAVTPGHYERGWHITSTCGVFGAAAAAGKVLQLDESQYLSALGIAATQASGLAEVFGTKARILNAGFAGRNGQGAALLAAQGFQGPDRPITGARGFLSVLGGEGDASQITKSLGQHWQLTEVTYKPYPCGVVLHALLDACLESREKLCQADSVTVTLNPLAMERTNRPEPRNSVEAKLSVQHALAVALMRGRAGLAEFSDEAANDPALQAFRRRVVVVPDERLDKMAAVIRSGKTVVQAHAPRAMDDSQLTAKFRQLAGSRADEWIRLVDSLESLDRVRLP
jgi:2-methylcitrate dehydratase PrpD